MYILQCNYIKYLTNVSLNAKKLTRNWITPLIASQSWVFVFPLIYLLKYLGKYKNVSHWLQYKILIMFCLSLSSNSLRPEHTKKVLANEWNMVITFKPVTIYNKFLTSAHKIGTTIRIHISNIQCKLPV